MPATSPSRSTASASVPRREAPRAAEGVLTWEEVCARPELQDLPYKIELDRYGRIVMSPAPSRHSILQRKLQRIIEDALGGIALPECPIDTPEGTKVADVAWMEESFAVAHQETSAFPVAPPICVEIMSRSNTTGEMEEKVAIYLAKGAQEVWVHQRDGQLRFFAHEGEIERSRLAPGAPDRVEL
ncbi:MAG: Uma2 family endonuclease [Bacteroidota bacterium]